MIMMIPKQTKNHPNKQPKPKQTNNCGRFKRKSIHLVIYKHAEIYERNTYLR